MTVRGARKYACAALTCGVADGTERAGKTAPSENSGGQAGRAAPKDRAESAENGITERAARTNCAANTADCPGQGNGAAVTGTADITGATGAAPRSSGAAASGGRRLTASPTPYLDADCFLEAVTQKDRAWLLSHPEFELTDRQEKQFTECVARRRTGLAVAYITGRREFYGLDFCVTPDVLIPKPDTETLVEAALHEAARLTARKKSVTIADVCTGSGCVAVSVLRELSRTEPDADITAFATDISRKALSVAEKNAGRLLAPATRARLSFVCGDLLCDGVMKRCGAKPPQAGRGASLPQPERPFLFDMILSNPPYVPAGTAAELLKDGRGEPLLALDGDAGGDSDIAPASESCAAARAENLRNGDGLSVIRRLIPQAFQNLTDGGVFLTETGEYNAEQTARLMEAAGFRGVRIFSDLAGLPRVVRGQKSGSD